MNVNRVDLNLLVYLDALLRERNVTQAANQLNLSQLLRNLQAVRIVRLCYVISRRYV